MLYVLEYTIKTIKKEKGEKRMEGERRRKREKRGREGEENGNRTGLGGEGAGGSSTVVNEELESACELWVLIDVEKVWESLHHLLLLRRHRKACRYLRSQVLKREESCLNMPVPGPPFLSPPPTIIFHCSSPLYSASSFFFSPPDSHPQAPCSPLGGPSLGSLTCCCLTNPQLECLVKNGTLQSPSVMPKRI